MINTVVTQTKENHMGLIDTFKKMLAEEVHPAEQKIFYLEQEAVLDAKALFEKAKTDALEGNAVVSKLKADLQEALTKSRDLHQQAIDAATTAIKAAEADLARFKAAVAAHTSVLKVQSSQIVAPPAPVAVPIDNVEVHPEP